MVGDAGRIGILGSDLSGGHVIYVAAHEPRVKALVSQVSSVDTRPYKPYQPDPAKVIAQANAAASRIATGQRRQYPADRARATGAALVGAPVGDKVVRWAPVEQAGRVSAPALFVLAKNEELFSNTNNGQLACERVTGPRKLVMLPDITHYGVYDAERDRAIRLAIDWFDQYPASPPACLPCEGAPPTAKNPSEGCATHRPSPRRVRRTRATAGRGIGRRTRRAALTDAHLADEGRTSSPVRNMLPSPPPSRAGKLSNVVD